MSVYVVVAVVVVYGITFKRLLPPSISECNSWPIFNCNELNGLNTPTNNIIEIKTDKMLCVWSVGRLEGSK